MPRTAINTVYSHTLAEMAGVVRSMREFRHLRGRGVVVGSLKNLISWAPKQYARRERDLRSIDDIDKVLRYMRAIHQANMWRLPRQRLVEDFKKNQSRIEKYGGFGVYIEEPHYNVRGSIYEMCALYDISCAICGDVCGNNTIRPAKSPCLSRLNRIERRNPGHSRFRSWWTFFRSDEWNEAMDASPRNRGQDDPRFEFSPLCQKCSRRYEHYYETKYGTSKKAKEIAAVELMTKVLRAA